VSRRLPAGDLLAALLDAGTYRSWDTTPVDVRPGPGYAAELARARAATGADESIRTGEWNAVRTRGCVK
jgi:acyl-CoA carboxylase subunit beta